MSSAIDLPLLYGQRFAQWVKFMLDDQKVIKVQILMHCDTCPKYVILYQGPILSSFGGVAQNNSFAFT